MNVKDIVINNKPAKGIEIRLPNASLVMVIGEKGYIMCGYLNMAAAQKFGDCAAIIKGVATVDDILKGKVVEVSPAARQAGVTDGMTGREALEKML